MPKQKMLDLLYELMKNSKRSDRELAKIVKVSQPTITRMRKTLEKSKYIHEYTVMPALEKLGFEILAFNFLSLRAEKEKDASFQEWLMKSPKVFFAASGSGSRGRNVVLISIHKDFTDFSTFTHNLEGLSGSDISSVESFLISLRNDVIKHFTYKNLEKV